MMVHIMMQLRSHEWNTNSPGLAYRQYTSNYWNDPSAGGDIIK